MKLHFTEVKENQLEVKEILSINILLTTINSKTYIA